jgi:large subunit ribosomal protein L32
MRRSQIKLSSRASVICANCGKSILPHRACPSCGYYKGRQVIDMVKKAEKKAAGAKIKAKANNR